MSHKLEGREFWITRHEDSVDIDKLTHIVLFSYHADKNPLRVLEAKPVLKIIVELEAQLKMKAENGCCIVEHGWRMSAEHEVKSLTAQLEKAESFLTTIKYGMRGSSVMNRAQMIEVASTYLSQRKVKDE